MERERIMRGEYFNLFVDDGFVQSGTEWNSKAVFW